MTTATRRRPAGESRRWVASTLLLMLGGVLGLLSVYSTSRGACAIWVTLALALTLVAGLTFPRRPASAG